MIMAPWLQQCFPRFLVVGSLGFIVDSTLLTLLRNVLRVEPFGARAVSFCCAITATWLLNRAFTFRQVEGRSAGNELSRYGTVSAIALGINLTTYTGVALTWPLAYQWPILALVPGAAVGLVINYLGYRHIVFSGSLGPD